MSAATRPPKHVPRCMVRGCQLASGHLGKRHHSTPFGRALYYAPAMLTRWGGVGGEQGFRLVEFMTPAGPVSGPDVTAEFIRRFDPGPQPLR